MVHVQAGDWKSADAVLTDLMPEYRALGLHDGFEAVAQFLEAFYASQSRDMNVFGRQWATEHISSETVE